MKRVVVLGSINMDCVTTIDKHPLPGETVPGHSLNYFPGGKLIRLLQLHALGRRL